MSQSPRERAAGLECFRGNVDPTPIEGGITNANFVVEDRGERYFVRIGEDIPIHGVMRFNEVAASRAAAAAGISPAVVHSEPGALVLRFIEGATLDAAALTDPEQLDRALALVLRCHRDLRDHLEGPTLAFPVFHVIRSYLHILERDRHPRATECPKWRATVQELEVQIPERGIVFGHNDLLAANFIDDGDRLWLVDWDYAGWSSPYFDLAGLAANNEFDSEREERLLRGYFGEEAGALEVRRGFAAMKCAALLREALWSAVSETHSTLDFDYQAYTAQGFERLARALAKLEA